MQGGDDLLPMFWLDNYMICMEWKNHEGICIKLLKTKNKRENICVMYFYKLLNG